MMFGKKELMDISSANCKVLEDLRMAVEVLTGQRVRFERIDANTGVSRIFIGETLHDFSFVSGGIDAYNFSLAISGSGNGGDWYYARFEKPSEVMVCGEFNRVTRKTVAGELHMKWIGSSMTDRREVPIDLRAAQYCADVRNMSLEDLLAGKEAPPMFID